MQQADVVEVIYKREGREETFTGFTRIAGVQDFTFAGADFNRVLEFASDALKRAPGHRLMLKRAEAPYPMALPANVEELLRTDLPAAIQALSVGPQRVTIGVPRKRIYQGLRRGHDTLADALGEEVYLKARYPLLSRDILVEDPATGRWKKLVGPEDPATSDDRGRVWCGKLPVINVVSGWCTIQTEALLALALERYYLPRNWNPNMGWISHDLLAYMYDMYRKEKSDVIDS